MANRKLTAIIWIFAIAFLSVFTAQAEEPQYRMEGSFEYYLQEDGAYITQYTGTESSVQIPGKIGGVKVNSVGLVRTGANLFVKEVILPEEPVRLSADAFRGMANLKNLQGIDRVTSVGTYAFRESGMTELAFSDALESLDEYSLYGATQITIPDDVKLIHSQTNVNSETYMVISPFCSYRLDSIVLFRGSGTPTMKMTDGVLFSADGETLICYPAGKQDVSYSIPEGTRVIGQEAFFGMNFFLKELHIPASVEKIGTIAFHIAKETDVFAFRDTEGWRYFSEMASRNSPVHLMEEGQEAGTAQKLVNRIVEEVTDSSMSVYEKAVALHDWLIDYGEYDFENNNGDGMVMLRTGKGICQAYMEAYRLLLGGAGIPSREAGNVEHAFAAVNVNGEWMYVDCTWDDVDSGSKWDRHLYFGFDDKIRYEVYGASGLTGNTETDMANEAGVKADNYHLHYWIRNGHGVPDTEKARETVQNRLDAGEGIFSIPWDGQEAACALMAEILSDMEWQFGGKTVRLTCSWTDGQVYRSVSHLHPIGDSGTLFCAVADENGKDQDFTYDLYAGGIRILSYTGGKDEVTVPETINGIPVTIIGKDAFFRNTEVRKVKLPDSIQEIEGRAFAFDKALESINMPAALETIGDYAFRGCSGLMGTLNLPEGLTKIGSYAFQECSGLTEIYLPSTMKALIPGVIFTDCTGLQSVTISEGVEVIDRSTFSGCTSLKSVTLPESLTFLGGDAFFNTALETVRIPANTKLENNPFENCLSLIRIEIAEGNPYHILRDGNVYSADGKRLCIVLPGRHYDRFRVPDQVTEIGERSFGGVEIHALEIPSSVQKVENESFTFLRGLNSLWLADGSCRELDEFSFFLSSMNLGPLRLPRDCTPEQRELILKHMTLHKTETGRWEYNDGAWYYYNADGTMAVGWASIHDRIFCFDREGHLVTGDVMMDGIHYTFRASGELYNYYTMEELLEKTANNTQIPDVLPWKEEEEKEQEESEKPAWLPGDVNGDDTVDGRDVIRLMKYLALETDEETGMVYEIREDNADVNADGIVDEKDLLRLIRYLSGENVILERGA